VVRVRNEDLSEERLKAIVESARSARGSPLPRQGEGDRG
jgi:hypothetical protein